MKRVQVAGLKGKSGQNCLYFKLTSSNQHIFRKLFVIYLIKNYHSRVKFEDKNYLLTSSSDMAERPRELDQRFQMGAGSI